jgi:hypothetical protein
MRYVSPDLVLGTDREMFLHTGRCTQKVDKRMSLLVGEDNAWNASNAAVVIQVKALPRGIPQNRFRSAQI